MSENAEAARVKDRQDVVEEEGAGGVVEACGGGGLVGDDDDLGIVVGKVGRVDELLSERSGDMSSDSIVLSDKLVPVLVGVRLAGLLGLGGFEPDVLVTLLDDLDIVIDGETELLEEADIFYA